MLPFLVKPFQKNKSKGKVLLTFLLKNNLSSFTTFAITISYCFTPTK